MAIAIRFGEELGRVVLVDAQVALQPDSVTAQMHKNLIRIGQLTGDNRQMAEAYLIRVSVAMETNKPLPLVESVIGTAER